MPIFLITVTINRINSCQPSSDHRMFEQQIFKESLKVVKCGRFYAEVEELTEY